MNSLHQPRSSMPDAALEHDLRDLGASIAWPPTPDLAPNVRARLLAPPAALPGWRTRSNAPRRPFAIAAVILLALVAGVLLASGLRHTVADILGVRGIRIVIERAHPTVPPTVAPGSPPVPVGQRLLLGDRLDLKAAQRLAGFRIHAPAPDHLGQPDEVYARSLPGGSVMISLVYLPDARLPETTETGVGLLLMEFTAASDTGYLVKSLVGEGKLSVVTVNGREGWWIEGTSQLIMLTDPTSGCCPGPRRASGNILLWEQGGVTFRMESALPRDAAVAIASTVAPLPLPASDAPSVIAGDD
jgi:hypothetical protein